MGGEVSACKFGRQVDGRPQRFETEDFWALNLGASAFAFGGLCLFGRITQSGQMPCFLSIGSRRARLISAGSNAILGAVKPWRVAAAGGIDIRNPSTQLTLRRGLCRPSLTMHLQFQRQFVTPFCSTSCFN